MIEFLMMLFFGRTTELTQSPVDISPPSLSFEMELDKTIKALTEGASLRIEVTQMIKERNPRSISKDREEVEKLFPDRSVRATLVGESSTHELVFTGNTSIGNEDVAISLHSTTYPISTNVEYDKVIIDTDVPMENVRIFWSNYSK